MKNFKMFLLAFLLLSLPSIANSNNHIGNIKTIKGNCFIVHNAKKINTVPGLMLYEGDQVITEKDSALGVIFIDGTVMTIGENSELFLNKYVFKPLEKEYDFDVFLKKGTSIYNSGRLGKLNPEAVKIRTPKATVGIRGTKFLIKVK
jgi:hypothetical protein